MEEIILEKSKFMERSKLIGKEEIDGGDISGSEKFLKKSRGFLEKEEIDGGDISGGDNFGKEEIDWKRGK